MANILLIGGTGVIGNSLTQQLITSNNNIYITTRNKSLESYGNVTFLQGDSLCVKFIVNTIKSVNFDVIIDFMVYATESFEKIIGTFLDNCSHYIFLSSYRVYSDSKNEKLTEKSLRLIDDLSIDINYRQSEEYAIKKAKQENIIFLQNKKNWTILRPSITFGINRLQLFCFEANLFLPRINNNLAIIIPKNIGNIKTTHTDSDLAAQYISCLINNPSTFGEVFNLCSNKVLRWNDIFQFYSKEFEAEFHEVDYSTFETLHLNQYQVKYDRMLNRELSNLKLKKIIGTTISEIDFFEKLKISIKKSTVHKFTGGRINGRMDKILNQSNRELINSNKGKLIYCIGFNYLLNSIYGILNQNKYLR
jgi:nucleoside-diphosphate-sugar epimerase